MVLLTELKMTLGSALELEISKSINILHIAKGQNVQHQPARQRSRGIAKRRDLRPRAEELLRPRSRDTRLRPPSLAPRLVAAKLSATTYSRTTLHGARGVFSSNHLLCEA